MSSLNPPTPNAAMPAAPPPTGLPAALLTSPTMLRLMKALRRCWLRATVVGVIVAGVAAFVAWSVIPTSTHTARTLLRVPPISTVLFRLNEPVPNLGDHQRTQVALAKSRLVLNAALRAPGVSELSIVKKQKDAVEWLEKEVQADFSVAPEVLRIALTGENPDELKTLVNALREAYRTGILERETKERVERLDLLAKKHVIFSEKLREKVEGQRKIERAAALPRNEGMRHLIQMFNHTQLSWYEKDLIQTQSDMHRNNAELKGLKTLQKDLATTPISDADVQGQLATDPAVLAAMAKVGHFSALVDGIKATAAQGESAPAMQRARKDLADAEAALTALKKKLAPEAAEHVRVLRGKATADTIAQLTVKLATEAETEKELLAQVDSLRQNVQKMVESSNQFDDYKDETTQLGDFTKRIADEEEKLRFEIEAPSRVMLLEEAVVQRATDDKRLMMATTGVFFGALAAVLLGFALHEFRARRIDNVEEVVHGLGMNLIGTIPDSTAAAKAASGNEHAAHSTLAEAVDATRVMLLRAARQEALRVVMVTSAQGGEGKTSLSTHLAASLAQVGLNTLLIDGDLRNPVAHQVFDLEPAPGFCELLRGDVTAEEVTRPTTVDRLSMIPAGRWSSKASRALAQDGVAGRIIRQFREQYDFVIIDSSPVLPVVDPLLIGQLVDGTILSVLRDVSRMPNVYAAHQRLIAGGVRVLGAVVNGVRGEAYGAIYPYRQQVG